MQIISLPNGKRAAIDGSSYYADGANFFVVNPAGDVVASYVCDSALAATGMVTQLDTGLAAASSAQSNSITSLTDLTLVSIAPDPFDIVTDTVTITGTGFLPNAAYLLRIEDVAGGTDSDSYAMLCTYVNATTLTAVYLSPGNGDLGASVIVYLQNLFGTVSNTLAGTASGTTITI